MIKRWFAALCSLGTAIAFSVSQAGAVDVDIAVASQDTELVEDLKGASLLAGLKGKADTAPQDVIAAARADYENFLNSLYQNGYYGVVISIKVDGREAADISTIAPPASVQSVTARISPGPRFVFSRARIAPIAPQTQTPDAFKPGQIARSTAIVDAADNAISDWRDQAHAKARVTGQNITADHRRSTLAADIRIDPGPRLRFGNLKIADSGKVRPKRVREIADLPTGEPFSPEELRKSSERLRRTGAFRSVVLQEAETIGPDNTLDVLATLQAAKPRRIGFGAEIASLEGLTLSMFWLHRNLLGGAERLRFDAEAGGIGGDSGGEDYLLSVRFERPATFSSETGLYLSALLQQLDEPDFRERRARVEAGLQHRFSDTLRAEVGLAYQYTDINDALGSRIVEHFLLPARLTYDGRKSTLDPREGYYADLEVTPFFGLNGNSDNGTRIYTDLRSYFGFGQNKGVVLASRFQLGTVIGPSAGSIPPGMLFFSGGSGTVRGQPFQSLGVDLPSGEQIGGRSFAALSLEVRLDVAENWSVVGFTDAGFVGEDSFATNSGDSHAGAGFGVRYNTGIGPIRFDVATPLDDDAGNDFEIYIGIGQAF